MGWYRRRLLAQSPIGQRHGNYDWRTAFPGRCVRVSGFRLIADGLCAPTRGDMACPRCRVKQRRVRRLLRFSAKQSFTDQGWGSCAGGVLLGHVLGIHSDFSRTLCNVTRCFFSESLLRPGHPLWNRRAFGFPQAFVYQRPACALQRARSIEPLLRRRVVAPTTACPVRQ